MKPIEFRGKETMSYNKTEKPLPPAEGAEEYFLEALGISDFPKHKVILHWYDITKLMHEFATLHAQKCGLPPSELLRQRDELIEILNDIFSNIELADSSAVRKRVLDAIKSTEQ